MIEMFLLFDMESDDQCGQQRVLNGIIRERRRDIDSQSVVWVGRRSEDCKWPLRFLKSVEDDQWIAWCSVGCCPDVRWRSQ
jgi:hypothetical protein